MTHTSRAQCLCHVTVTVGEYNALRAELADLRQKLTKKGDDMTYPVAIGRCFAEPEHECNWCGGPADKPGLNSRGESCPCQCHGEQVDR